MGLLLSTSSHSSLSCCVDGRSPAGSIDWPTSAPASPSSRAACPRSGWPQLPCRATSAWDSTRRSRTSPATRTPRHHPEQPPLAPPTAAATLEFNTASKQPANHLAPTTNLTSYCSLGLGGGERTPSRAQTCRDPAARPRNQTEPLVNLELEP